MMLTTKGLLIVVTMGLLTAQSPRATTELRLAEATIAIDYGRPSLKGRDMLSLLPKGHTWRLGADEATRLETSHDLLFAGVEVPAGAYSLFLRRGDDPDWTLVFNRETGQWGTQHDATMDFAEVPLRWSKRETASEQLTIELSKGEAGGEIEIFWSKDLLSVSFVLP